MCQKREPNNYNKSSKNHKPITNTQTKKRALGANVKLIPENYKISFKPPKRKKLNLGNKLEN